MELPIFNDNLKSSASWTEALATERKLWDQSPAKLEKTRVNQLEHLLRRAVGELDQGRLLAAAEKVSSWAAESDARFSKDRLLELHAILTGTNAELRQNEPQPLNALHDPTPAILLAKMLDLAFDWFSTDSFAELHAVEQATVVYLRLLDLYPFPAVNEPTAMLAASFYTERAGFPPLVILSDDITQARFNQAFETAQRMLTQPMVELFAEMLRKAMER
ncbi:MAG: Fic family protein [Acidobacteriota bacterium]|nr:Fic family protein [Acidobacteriota bacterium]